jgi:P-type conjugative transfer protein TrbJ
MLSLYFVLPFSAKAMGYPVFDFTNMINMGLHLEQLKSQTLALKAELEQLSGNQFAWGNAQTLINNLGGIVNQTNSLSYSSSNLNQKFQQAFPGYNPPQDYSQQYKTNTNMTMNTLNGILQSLGSSAADFQNENSRLTFLQQQSQSAQGQTQAIQAATQIASEMVSQQQLLRQVMVAQTNAQTTYYANNIQNEASAKAELQQVIQSGSTNVPAYGTSGNNLTTPEF